MMGLRSFLSLFDATVPLEKSKAWTIAKIVKLRACSQKRRMAISPALTRNLFNLKRHGFWLRSDPLPNIRWAMKEFSSLLLTSAQQADHMNVHNRDFFQIQGGFRTAPSELVHNLAQVLRSRPLNQADDGSFFHPNWVRALTSGALGAL